MGKSWLKGETRRLVLAHLVQRDGARCHYCRRPFASDLSDATLNHYIPRRLWNEHRPRNLVLACEPCASRKGDALPVTLAVVLPRLVETQPEWRRACSGSAPRPSEEDRARLARLLGEDSPGVRRKKLGKRQRQEIPRLLMERDGERCFYCRDPFPNGKRWTLDHYIPHRLWPGWALENLVLACEPCNLAKSGVLPPVMARLLLSLAA